MRQGLIRGVLVGLMALAITPAVRADDFQNPKANIPPKAKPQRRNGGEGMPPLPLPATPAAPQREKARAGTARPDRQYHLFRRVPERAAAGRRRSSISSSGSSSPTANSGRSTASSARISVSSATTRPNCRSSISPGGNRSRSLTMRRSPSSGSISWTAARSVVHSNCGRPEFNASFRREIARIFPDRELAPDPERSSDLQQLLSDHRDDGPQR